MTNYYRKCRITLTNDFHNTKVSLHGFFKAGSDGIYITKRQAMKARKELCGIEGCTCGDFAGCRPEQVEDPGIGLGFCPVYVKPDKVFDGWYKWEFPNKTGRLIKEG